MNRLWLGVGLLILFLILGITTAFLLQNTQQPIVQALEEAAALSLTGDLAGGASKAQDALTHWQKNWRGIAAVSIHGPMEEIDSLFAQLPALSAAGQAGDFSACCARLACLAEAIGDAQSFSWWNLL